MELEIVGKRENPFLKRTEVSFRVTHPREQTPGRAALRQELAKVLHATRDIVVVDFKTKRIDEPRWHTKLKGVGDWVVVIDNPAGVIKKEVWPVISEAFKSRERVRLEVRGEEDLLALVCIALAPEGAVVAYGQPDEGAVVVRVDRASKGRVHEILRRMVA